MPGLNGGIIGTIDHNVILWEISAGNNKWLLRPFCRLATSSAIHWLRWRRRTARRGQPRLFLTHVMVKIGAVDVFSVHEEYATAVK
jgi:hypothetical protein